MIEELHHIGIAVADLDEAVRMWTEVLGLALHGVEEVPGEGVRVAVLLAGRTRIELLAPTREDSPVAKFMRKRGPGIHHLAFEVASAQDAIDRLGAAGAPLLDEAPRAGAHGTKVAFVHPKGLGGVLAELVEDPK
jgi:methylmalonyl-CoA/ethylmalonyl-CoA epimerase